MAFFRKAGNILRTTVSNHISQDIYLSKPSIFQAVRCMSTSKLFIGGLSYSTDDTSLREAFNKYGDVAEARVIVDRETGRSRGFGFVTFSSVEEASSAIQALDQQELHGRRIRVDYANDRTRGFGGGGFGGGNFGGGGGGYGGGGFGGGGGGGYGGSGFGEGGGGGGYGGGGGGGFAGGSNFNSGVNSYGSGEGAEGSNNYASNTGCADGFGEKFSNEQSNIEGVANEGFGQDQSLEGTYDESRDNYADRRS